jgi:hypothetical protein
LIVGIIGNAHGKGGPGSLFESGGEIEQAGLREESLEASIDLLLGGSNCVSSSARVVVLALLHVVRGDDLPSEPLGIKLLYWSAPGSLLRGKGYWTWLVFGEQPR